jgi:DNA-binding transcriptional MerR regulator
MTANTAPHGHHRSGTVARMLGVPVATLRNWERRYALTQAATSPSGQRLYSAADVRRLTFIKQLNDLGHAIGQLAPLDMAQLQHVAATHASTLAATQPTNRAATQAMAPRPALRLAVIGPALEERLRRPALLQRMGAALALLGPFENAAQAATALADTPVDAVLVQQPQLHPDWLAAFDAAAPALAATPKAVLYRFAADAVSDALTDAGLRLLREPQPDSVLAQWLQDLRASRPDAPFTPPLPPTPAPRRWSDAALADFARLSSTIACECPRHLAELLVQLSHFEAYSADCEHRNAADAALHGHLVRVTAACRSSLEVALEHVARHEGLLLPR